jgi:hypothetical protein
VVANSSMMTFVTVGSSRLAAHTEVLSVAGGSIASLSSQQAAMMNVVVRNTTTAVVERRAFTADAKLANSATFVTLATGGLNVTGSITANELRMHRFAGSVGDTSRSVGIFKLPAGPQHTAPSVASLRTQAAFAVDRNTVEVGVRNGTMSRFAFALLSPSTENPTALQSAAFAASPLDSPPVLVITSLGGGNVTCVSFDGSALPCGFDIVAASSGWMAADRRELSVNAALTPAFLRVDMTRKCPRGGREPASPPRSASATRAPSRRFFRKGSPHSVLRSTRPWVAHRHSAAGTIPSSASLPSAVWATRRPPVRSPSFRRHGQP